MARVADVFAGHMVEILINGYWTGPYLVTNLEGRTPDHLVLKTYNGVFEHYYDGEFNTRLVK